MMVSALLFLFVLEAREPAGAKEIFQGVPGQYLNDSGKVGAPGRAASPPVPGPRPIRPAPGSKPSLKPPSRLAEVREPAQPGLSCWIELIEGDGRPGQRVAPTRSFRSGEKIRLHFESNLDGHIWIATVDASGSASQIFPDPAKGLTDDRLTAFVSRALPAETHWLRFDEKRGQERLLVVFSPAQASMAALRLADQESGPKILALARERLGSKGLIVEAEDTVAEERALYTVSLDGSPVIQEIVLTHN